jgi:orotate phosphoribosyltransferase
MLSQMTGLPCCFVRKQPKEHGTCLSIEGTDPLGHDICIVEDVITSGGAVFDAIDDLQKHKPHNIGSVVCAIARWTCKLDTSGAVEEGPAALKKFDEYQVNLFPLLTLTDLDPYLEEAKK